MQVVGREAPADLLQLVIRRPDRFARDVHARFRQHPPALLQVTGRTGRRDIGPARTPALGARDDVIEGQLLA